MSLLAEVVERLRAAGVPHCLIGAAALAVHGVPRSTQDDDLLVADVRVLEVDFWATLGAVAVRAVHGEADDPLAGAVRLERASERSVDVMVGRRDWQRGVIGDARPARLPGVDIPVAEPADMVVLKLDAGGPQDRFDVEMLLEAHGADLAVAVEARLATLPDAIGVAWREVRGAAG